MQAISNEMDMVFRWEVYTARMAGAISQIQMVYSPEEDRILFRLNTVDKQEFRFWITRRYAMLLLKVLHDHKLKDPDIATRSTPLEREAVQSFKKEKAISEARFGEKFQEEDNEFPLGKAIRLAYKLTFKMGNDGTLQLGVQPRVGQGINVVLNQEINITMTQLLLTAARKGDWKLDEWLERGAPAMSGEVVIN